MTHYVLTMSTRQARVLLRRIDRNKENPMNDVGRLFGYHDTVSQQLTKDCEESLS